MEIRAGKPEQQENVSGVTSSEAGTTQWTESHGTDGRSVTDNNTEEREKQEKILRRYRAMDIRREKKDD